jgi:hypothetical protein
MSESYSQMVLEFARSTQNACLYSSLLTVGILLFIMSPLNKMILCSIFNKIIALGLLGYMLYYNISQTITFSNYFDLSVTRGNWNILEKNVVCSHVFSAFLFVLFISMGKIILNS